MSQFVVRYRGKGPAPADALERAAQTPGLRVVDHSARSMLIEGTEETVRAAFDDATQWLIAPEVTYEMPDPRPKVKRPPAE